MIHNTFSKTSKTIFYLKFMSNFFYISISENIKKKNGKKKFIA